MALVDQCLDLVDDEPGRDRAAVSASVGDDAEGAAMVAAILHLDKGARALREAGDEMRGGRLDRHDIGNPGFSFICETGRVELFPVAEHPARSEEHPSELQSLLRIPYAVPCL